MITPHSTTGERRVLFVDENTGCIDLAMDVNNPRVLIAGMWQFVIHTWGKFSGGPGSGIYMSTDGGSTWKPIRGNGLPTSSMGKIAVAIAPPDHPHTRPGPRGWRPLVTWDLDIAPGQVGPLVAPGTTP
ncbi:MAG: hypothetical protein HYX76_01725 [Acidobacteria bacterium]|nr:hypothetical protein [Acidobacteriota bacterium]